VITRLLLFVFFIYQLVRLADCQPVSSVFLSLQISISHQPPASEQYFSLTTTLHQPPATSQPNKTYISPVFILFFKKISDASSM
jgi:hypothetical protein